MARQIAVPEMIVPADEYDLGGLNPFDLSGRHALVTGATRPLARAVARALAEAGARISVTTLDGGPAELAVADSILEGGRALGRAGVARELDLTDANAVDAAVEEIEAEVGSIDILVHAVQEANIKPVLAASLEDWRRELDRNVTSLFVTTQAVGRRMVERGYGRITTFSSVLHDRGIPHASLFGASQGAIVGYTRSLGLEWGAQRRHGQHGHAGLLRRGSRPPGRPRDRLDPGALHPAQAVGYPERYRGRGGLPELGARGLR